MYNTKRLLPIILIITLCINCSNDKSLSPPSINQTDYLSSLSPTEINDIKGWIEPKYSYIRSYPSGGGIFVIRNLPIINQNDNLVPNFSIALRAHPDLNAVMTTYPSWQRSGIAEITIEPTHDIDIDTFQMQLSVIRDGLMYRVLLEVDVFPLYDMDDSLAAVKRDQFIPWLNVNFSEYGDIADSVWNSYLTYPQIWIVEHWTFLSEKYEIRLCWHVMIPPYDWSMLCIRERGDWKPSLALRRESDGGISEIPILEYPSFYGY